MWLLKFLKVCWSFIYISLNCLNRVCIFFLMQLCFWNNLYFLQCASRIFTSEFCSEVSHLCIINCIDIFLLVFPVLISFKDLLISFQSRVSEIFHLLVHSADGHNSGGWARLKLGGCKSIQVLPHVWQGTKDLCHHLLSPRIHISRQLDAKLRSQDSGTKHSDIGHQCPRLWLHLCHNSHPFHRSLYIYTHTQTHTHTYTHTHMYIHRLY